MYRIAGISLQAHQPDRALLNRMTKRLIDSHQKNCKAYAYHRVGLLSVHSSAINQNQLLSMGDNQPAVLIDGTIHNASELRTKLVTKGYFFSTRREEEVVAQAYRTYGDDFIEHLNGMFSLVLYDQRQERLLLARDRLGIKPLFLRSLSQGVAFASEPKMLLSLDSKPALNPHGLAEFMAHQFIGGHHTIWADTEKVMPGEAVIIEAGKITKRWRYWDARKIESRKVTYEAAAAEFDGLFEQICQEYLPTAEPIGLLLSGGVDSGTILGQLHRLNGDELSVYTAGFPKLRNHDELPLAQAQAARFGVPLTAIEPTTDDLLRALPPVLWAADDLMHDLANLPTLLLAKAVSRQHTVVFSGEGADEVFGGYGRYRTRFKDRIKALRWPGSGGFRTHSNVPSKKQRQLYRDDLLEAARHHRSPFINAWQSTPEGWSNMQRRQYVDLVTALPDNLMVKVDRMLARYGVEGRLPFLDHRVVEFGFSLPDSLKLQDKHGKWFLKSWATRYLDREQLFARKRGFRVPLLSHMSIADIQRLQQMLPEQPGVREWFQPKSVRALLASDAAKGKLSQTSFLIMQFALWHTLFIIGDGSAPPEGIHPLELLEAGT